MIPLYYRAGKTRTQIRHIERALVIAEQSTCNQKHGVVVAMGKRVLAVGVNRNRNDPRVCSHPKIEAAVHAEIAALKQLRGVDLRRATLYSARMDKTGNPALARPCTRCQAVIDYLEIGEVFWT